MVVISLSFQSFALLFINLSNNFGNSFAFDAPTVWNALPDEIHASPSLASFRKQLKTYLYTKAYPPWPGSFPWCSLWCLTPLMFLDTEILLTAFALLHLIVLLFGEIKHSSYNSS